MYAFVIFVETNLGRINQDNKNHHTERLRGSGINAIALGLKTTQVQIFIWFDF